QLVRPCHRARPSPARHRPGGWSARPVRWLSPGTADGIGDEIPAMVESSLLAFSGLVTLTKGTLQALLLTKLTTGPLALLSAFVVGAVLGATVGSSFWFPAKEPATEVKEGAVYQGKPASSWIAQLQDNDPFARLEAVQALEHIGPKEKAVVSSLARM